MPITKDQHSPENMLDVLSLKLQSIYTAPQPQVQAATRHLQKGSPLVLVVQTLYYTTRPGRSRPCPWCRFAFEQYVLTKLHSSSVLQAAACLHSQDPLPLQPIPIEPHYNLLQRSCLAPGPPLWQCHSRSSTTLQENPTSGTMTMLTLRPSLKLGEMWDPSHWSMDIWRHGFCAVSRSCHPNHCRVQRGGGSTAT